ncbi:MAG: alpha-galactosidase [Candidatus Solibacter usitatus]|nr:alpha-galactosidase [Acidobacteriota bacterium]MBI5282959.1 alpha-galactosidase [Candidatus Solibacter usitatus]
MLCAFLLLAALSGSGAMEQSRGFLRAKLLGESVAPPVRSHMLAYLKRGAIGKNAIQGRPLRIKNQEFTRGIVMPSPGEIHVILAAPAASFEALVGTDSNDLGYYANQDRGGVEASVEVAGRAVFRSPYLKEGIPGAQVNVSLDGAREFRLKLASVGEKSRFHQEQWDQADWAMARIRMADGSTVWLADLPIGPLEPPATVDLPFSFRYNGRPSSQILREWLLKRESRQLDEHRTEHTLSFSHPSSPLALRAVAVEYAGHPAVEWTLHFRNTGTSMTGMIEDIQALDTSFSRAGGGEFLLHHGLGSRTLDDDYKPLETPLTPKLEKKLATVGGRASDAEMPYFNLAWPGRGVICAVGWPGQWAARFTRDEGTSVRVVAGQELTHFRLKPGEEVRSPLIAMVFYQGDWIDGQNVWRRWMVAHNVPRPGGKLHPPQVAEGNGRHTIEMQEANEANQLRDLNRELDHGVPLDYWWMDAGWYPFTTNWTDVGTWEPDPARFPRGFAPVSRLAHERGTKILVWFEPERVRPGTWLDKNHPEWLLKLPGNSNRLLDLGNDDARRWLTEHVTRTIREQGIDLYRQDFNFEPLPFWRANDAPDRQGISEIKHVTGYLAYWDELRRRFPAMMIDTCASGGRRNDLETLRRAVPLWRSDKAYDPIPMQALSYGIALWIPYHGTGINSVEPFIFRSQMSPALALGLDASNVPNGYDNLKRRIAEWRQVAWNYYGDYYPLTPYTLDAVSWMAWQFDTPAKGEGMVQAFRRPESPFETARFKLRGLDANATYAVTDLDGKGESVMSGAELMERGIPVTINASPGAAIVAYRRR